MKGVVRIAGAVVLSILALPLVALLSLFPSKNTMSPEEAATYIRDCLEGGGGEWDWDDFTSIPLDDPLVDNIRRRALAVDLPLDEAGRAALRALLAELELLGTRF